MEKMNSNKAWVAAGMTMATVVFAMFGIGDMPAPETVQASLMAIGTTIVSGAVSWIMTWLVANKKITKPEGE